MKLLLALTIFCFLSCHHGHTDNPILNRPMASKIYIQPFDDLPASYSAYLFKDLKKFYPEIILLGHVSLPRQAWYEPRKRFRADSLIHWLKNRVKEDDVVIGLTSKDISTTKNEMKDFGVMGLGFTPGKSCVVSTFRLNRQNLKQQFFKVAIHELGHTRGLNHCPVKTCFMRNAEGGNPTDEEKEFCKSCRQYLARRGWTL